MACILITNSHFDILYGNYSWLSTGGAIGDALFFFCSGFALYLGGERRFDNWYKRRIRRIYPTVFAWALISIFIFEEQLTISRVFGADFWFVCCIMIYYPVFYIVKKYFKESLRLVCLILFLIFGIFYLLPILPQGYMIFADSMFRWCFFFIYMLLGAIIGKKSYVERAITPQKHSLI